MNWKTWLALGLLASTLLLAYAARPSAAQPAPTPGTADRLERIERQLVQIEKTLELMQLQLKEMQPQKGWQKISEAGNGKQYIVMFNNETGKVKYVDPTAPSNTVEK
jgi:hypothetical protein